MAVGRMDGAWLRMDEDPRIFILWEEKREEEK